MIKLFRIVVAHAFAVSIAGCASQAATLPSAAVTPLRAKLVSAERVQDDVAVGKSTKADIIAALGETLVISFDTGYEVWVYRLANAGADGAAPTRRIARSGSEKAWSPSPAEFVILFAPNGVVAKTRIRPAS